MGAARKTAAVLLALIALLTAGCSAPVATAEVSPGPFQVIIESAVEGGADDAQLAILHEADAVAEVTLEQLKRAVDSTFDCFADAGIEFSSTVSEGVLPELTYSFAAPDGDSRVADTCIETHSAYVEWAYQTQPAALELVDAAFEAKRAEIIGCLQALGLAITDDATVDEIKTAASFTAEEWESTWKDAPTKPHDCVTRAGILNW